MAAAEALAGTAAYDVAVRAADPLSGYRAWIVPHTHWDREWYLPFEIFRIRLVRMLETAADTLEADPRIRHFTLDGQTVLLEDCAELRPDLIERLRVLAHAGRISVGPGYVMPDEFLPGPESLVRNLLHGQRVARRFGFDPMALGYAPDPFGHPGQLPQILAGFGFTDFLFWRGLGDAADELGAVFWWEAPDGTRVLAHRMLGSYGNANELGSWLADGPAEPTDEARVAAAANRPERFVDRHGKELERSATRDLLLCNGSDHQPLQVDIADMANAMAQAHPGMSVEIASFPEYVAAARRSLPADLGTFRGEMVEGRDAPVLRGINSSRIHLKQAFAAAEEALLTAESAAALASIHRHAPYPAAELEHGWRELLRNAPHDSVSGCSVDETHKAMLARFDTANQIARRIRREAIAAIGGNVARWSYQEPVGDAYSVLNLLPWGRADVVEVELPADPIGSAVQASRSKPGFGWLQLHLPAFGARTVSLATDKAVDGEARVVGDRRLENDSVTVEVAPDGTLTIDDLVTGDQWSEAHIFEDVADRGDEYNFCPVDGDEPVTSRGRLVRVDVLEPGPIVAALRLRYEMAVPTALSLDRVGRSTELTTLAIETDVRVTAGSRRVEFDTRVDNTARDHRLRVVFPTGSASETVAAEGAYCFVERPVRPASTGDGWLEPPSPTHHTRGVVTAGSIAVAGRGLPEYEAIQTPAGVDLALTLLRCVGWLSRDDLSSRPGGAGPSVAVPDAQLPGKHRFEYALWVGPADSTQRLRQGAEWRRPFTVGEAGVADSTLLPITGGGFADGALKAAVDGDGFILRLFAGSSGAMVGLPDAFDSSECRLDEEEVSGQSVVLSNGRYELPPARIASWRLRPNGKLF